MTMTDRPPGAAIDSWQYFNWPEIKREAKLRLQRQIGEADLEKSILEYWCAWCAHANAAAGLNEEIEKLRNERAGDQQKLFHVDIVIERTVAATIAATIERCAQWLEANDQPVLAENMRVGLKQQGY